MNWSDFPIVSEHLTGVTVAVTVVIAISALLFALRCIRTSPVSSSGNGTLWSEETSNESANKKASKSKLAANSKKVAKLKKAKDNASVVAESVKIAASKPSNSVKTKPLPDSTGVSGDNTYSVQSEAASFKSKKKVDEAELGAKKKVEREKVAAGESGDWTVAASKKKIKTKKELDQVQDKPRLVNNNERIDNNAIQADSKCMANGDLKVDDHCSATLINGNTAILVDSTAGRFQVDSEVATNKKNEATQLNEQAHGSGRSKVNQGKLSGSNNAAVTDNDKFESVHDVVNQSVESQSVLVDAVTSEEAFDADLDAIVNMKKQSVQSAAAQSKGKKKKKGNKEQSPAKDCSSEVNQVRTDDVDGDEVPSSAQDYLSLSNHRSNAEMASQSLVLNDAAVDRLKDFQDLDANCSMSLVDHNILPVEHLPVVDVLAINSLANEGASVRTQGLVFNELGDFSAVPDQGNRKKKKTRKDM